MSPSHIDSRVVTDKIAVIDRMLASLRDLPTTHLDSFLAEDRAGVLRKMAKYRNRMVHFYDEITPPELYEIITNHLDDSHDILGSVTAWLAEHPERVRSD